MGTTRGFLDGPRPWAIAHRGGAGVPRNRGSENSLAAFADAYARGYRRLETDVRTDRDGTLWATHDDDLLRQSGQALRVSESTTAQVRSIRLRGGEPLATLEELLDQFPDCTFSIDIKSDAALEPTCALIEARGDIDRVSLAAFDHARVQRIRRRLPAVATAASQREATIIVLTPTVVMKRWGLFGRFGSAPDYVSLPDRRGPLPVVTSLVLRRCRALGLPLCVWTIDDAATMRRLLDLGVDGLFTDRTDTLRSVLEERHQWRNP